MSKIEPEIIMQGEGIPLTSCVSMESFEQICNERDALEELLRECHFFIGDTDRIEHNPKRYEKMIRELVKYPSH